MLSKDWYPKTLREFKRLPERIKQGKARCEYITFTGFQCNEPVAEGDKYCYFHRKVADGLITIDPDILQLR